MPIFGFAVEPLGAPILFHIGPLAVTNSMLTGLVTAAFVFVLFGLAARASQSWPKSRLAFYVESLVGLIDGFIVDSFDDKQKAKKHFPLLVTLLIFILAGNLSGLLPGIETIIYHSKTGDVSLFRAWTTDLNSTLALAILSLATVHFYAVKEIGWRGYAKHFFAGKLYSPLTWFMGLNELFSEVLKLVTLSLRLFGVIYGGEAFLFAVAALAGNFGWAAMFPVTLLEIFISLIQAYLFMMLTAAYITMSTSHGSEEVAPGTQSAPGQPSQAAIVGGS